MKQFQLLGVIGNPIEHSVSPQMQNAALKELGLDQFFYVPILVDKNPATRIQEALLGLRALSFRGANITVPFKEKALQFVDHTSEDAKQIGAVNTILINDDQKICGFNTDAQGFINDLLEKQFSPKNQKVLILGAGGSARAIAYGLKKHKCKKIILLNRTQSKAEVIAKDFYDKNNSDLFECGEINFENLKRHTNCDLVINCTSLGLSHSDEMPWDPNIKFSQNQVVYDLIYNPTQTKFLHFAKDCGAKTSNGLGMLVHQGALAFEIWTGKPAPIHLMKMQALKALSGDE